MMGGRCGVWIPETRATAMTLILGGGREGEVVALAILYSLPFSRFTFHPLPFASYVLQPVNHFPYSDGA